MEEFEKLLLLVTSAIGTLTAIYKLVFKNDSKRKKLYYEKVLVPFIVAYKKNSNINSIKFVKNTVDNGSDDVPKYIFWLVEQNRKDELKKVLLYDYFDLYKNDSNQMDWLTYYISRILEYVIFIGAYVLAFLGGAFFGLWFYSILVAIWGSIENGVVLWRDMLNSFSNILYFAACEGAYILCILVVKKLNRDMYTYNKKKIEKMIEKKVKRYNKKIDEVVL